MPKGIFKHKPLSLETRDKISKARKGQRNWLGRHHSLETRKKMSLARQGRITGSKNPRWKGGITKLYLKDRNSIQAKLWREAVFKRDDWVCQKYGIRGKNLHPHHILNFSDHPTLRFDINNGITLSAKAHREFHKKYGRKNNTREQIEEFLKND